MASPKKRQRHDSPTMAAVPRALHFEEDEITAETAAAFESFVDERVNNTITTLEALLQKERSVRIHSQHALFEMGQSLRRLETAMLAQENEIQRLQRALRQRKLVAEHTTPSVPMAQEQIVPQGEKSPATVTSSKSVLWHFLKQTMLNRCERFDCKRRRKLLRRIRDKVASYRTILHQREAAHGDIGTQTEARQALDTDTLDNGLEDILRENNRLRQVNNAYKHYVDFISNTYRQIFSVSPSEASDE